jgi:hypothetical protein
MKPARASNCALVVNQSEPGNVALYVIKEVVQLVGHHRFSSDFSPFNHYIFTCYIIADDVYPVA